MTGNPAPLSKARSTPGSLRNWAICALGAPVRIQVTPRKPTLRNCAHRSEPKIGGSSSSAMFWSRMATSAGTDSPSVYERSALRTPITMSTKAARSSLVFPTEREQGSALRSSSSIPTQRSWREFLAAAPTSGLLLGAEVRTFGGGDAPTFE
eukprot:scaffold169688_cov29-Tisochrysis_lutea.AAC.4